MLKIGLAWGLFGLLGLAAACVVSRAEAGRDDEEDGKLEAYFRDYLEATFRARPMYATRLGDHRFDHLLDDLSPEARAANLERDRKFLADLPAKVDFDRLTDDGRIDYEIFAHDLERSIWLAETFDPYVDDPRAYGEFITESVYMLLTQSSLPKEQNLENVAARMLEVPRIIETARDTIGNPPRVKVETAILQTKGAINFYEQELFLLAGLPPGEGRIGRRAKPIVESLQHYLSFLQDEVLPRSTEDWRIGPEKFAKKLDLELDAGLTADDVLAEAKAEEARVGREMVVIARQLWSRYFPGEIVPPDDEEGRRTMVRRVLGAIAQDHGTPETLLDDVKATVADIKQFIDF